ncbi:MAG: PAS domain S-box protein, partial [Proteobacteria bacterium]|nr:PAS domain S-box protein [Pseudomonadota bacterium]
MKSKGNRHFVWAILATALGVAVVWIVDDEVADRHLKEHRTQVVDKVKTVHAKLESALNSRLSLVQGLAAFVKSRKELAGARHERFAEEFNAYTDELLKDVGGIRSLQLAPDAVVTYINPLKGNERALGHDLMADAVRREAAERAIRKRHFVVAGPVELRQGGVALIGRLPIFLPLADDEKSERFWGFSIILLDLAPLLTEAGISDQASGLKFALRGKDGLGARGAVFFGDGAIFDADPVVQDVILPDNSWQVAALPVEGWDHTEELFPLRAFGGAMAVAIGGLLFVLFSGREKLATKEKRLRSAFEAIDEGIWDWNIVTGEVVFSPNWPKIFGYSLDEIEHHVDTWESWLHPDDKAEVMKAVNDHFEGRTPYYVSEHRMKNKDGAWLWILDRGKVIEWDNGGKPIRMIRADLDITERKRADEALRESEERFRQIYENTPGMLHSIDRDGRLLNVSDYWLDTLGYDREEVLGRKVYEFYSEESRRYAKEETLPEFFRTGFAKELPFQVVKKNGEVMDVLLTAMAVRDDQGNFVRSLAVMIDITERKRAEKILRESEERFRTLIDSSSQGILVHRNLRVLYANQRFVEMFGYDSADEILALESRDVMIAPEERSRLLGYHKARLRGEPAPLDYEFVGLRKDGSRIWLENRSFRIEWEGGPAICTTLFDITGRKEAQAQLIQASKLATLGEMASGIAHELNQPLSVVGMAAENSLISMEEGTFDTEFVRKKLQTIVGQRDRMAGIVNHMRLFSRRDTTAMELFDPVESVRGAVGLIAKQFQASGIELEETLPAACGNVFGHPVQLEQVVLNLLNNARDAVRGAME